MTNRRTRVTERISVGVAALLVCLGGGGGVATAAPAGEQITPLAVPLFDIHEQPLAEQMLRDPNLLRQWIFPPPDPPGSAFPPNGLRPLVLPLVFIPEIATFGIDAVTGQQSGVVVLRARDRGPEDTDVPNLGSFHLRWTNLATGRSGETSLGKLYPFHRPSRIDSTVPLPNPETSIDTGPGPIALYVVGTNQPFTFDQYHEPATPGAIGDTQTVRPAAGPHPITFPGGGLLTVD